MRVAASIALVLAIAACRNDGTRSSSGEADRQMQAARPLAGCYLLAGDGVGPYRVQLYAWRTARAWVARPLGADTIGGTTSNDWSWTPAGPDSFEIRRSVVDSALDFAVRRADSGWAAVLLSASGGNVPEAATPARAERVECPFAEAAVHGGSG